MLRVCTFVSLAFVLFFVPDLQARGGRGAGRGASGGQPVHVNGHTRSNGTYVAPHMRTHPDSSRLNNWSTKGNVNPYTGNAGTRSPYGDTATVTHGAQYSGASTGDSHRAGSPPHAAGSAERGSLNRPSSAPPPSSTSTIQPARPSNQSGEGGFAWLLGLGGAGVATLLCCLKRPT